MSPVKSPIDRLLDVLELLAQEIQPLALGAIAGRLDLPKSATHRLMSHLLAAGWARQDPATGFYGLTLKLTLVGQRYLQRTGLPDLYQPFLDALARRTEAFVRLALVEGQELTWIGHAQGARAGLIYQPELVTEIQLNVTANGKAWLATMSDEEALRLMLAQGLAGPDRYGPRALTRIDALLADLALVRRRGWATAIEEAEAGVAAIAAAIVVPAGGPVVGTVSVAGPVVRMDEARRSELAAEVMATAAQIAALWPRPAAAPIQPMPILESTP